jgi:hypothetical protein
MEKEIEEYRIVNHPNNNGNFAVSNLGNVKNIKTKNIRTIGPKGTVTFNEAQQYSVGRLVALTFLALPGIDYTKKKVYHKDGNLFNNNVENLYWKY